jgi:hypothetical protein
MERAARDDAAGGHAELIRTANALAALRCYWGPTHRLGTAGPLWWADPRDGEHATVTAGCPAGLHVQLAARCGYVPPLGRRRAGSR